MAVRSLDDEISLLSSYAEEMGVLPAVIPVEDIVVSDWVRMKCRFGCKGYGKHLSCPPYTPDPEDMRRILLGYRTALLLRFDGDPAHPKIHPEDIPLDFHPFYREMILWIWDAVWKLEKMAFYDGYYKAFGFGAYPCIFCDECVVEEWEGPVDESIRRSCRQMDRVRPSMESVGMDVFATAKKVGWDIQPIPCAGYEYGKIEHGDIRSVALLLIE
ncbi:DUF2284 domain-containing protein [Methanocalculus taiwanensis]|uniref:DUF2284 domain-containing protein n=1 Tax=Methanocalculus taiwanensis TaxID=106207 RepID=A0ABD4TLN6_9EURY|nr:DUF2284 domain-containing protein [Methanocalculus taiwanensis]MCQ1538215.1 DUF2284 domain-containing protein [Methanocalculus taiwanensis]